MWATWSCRYWSGHAVSSAVSVREPVAVSVLMAPHLRDAEQPLWLHHEHQHEDEEDGHLR